MGYKKNIIPWNKGLRRQDICGEKSPNWKGGKYISSDGYRMVKVAERFDCKTPWKSYKREHTHVMEQHIGRPLAKGEIVHHIDSDKLNNILNNLFLTNHKDHRKAHVSLEKLAIYLYKCGFVTFNKKESIYEFSQKFLEALCKLN